MPHLCSRPHLDPPPPPAPSRYPWPLLRPVISDLILQILGGYEQAEREQVGLHKQLPSAPPPSLLPPLASSRAPLLPPSSFLPPSLPPSCYPTPLFFPPPPPSSSSSSASPAPAPPLPSPFHPPPHPLPLLHPPPLLLLLLSSSPSSSASPPLLPPIPSALTAPPLPSACVARWDPRGRYRPRSHSTCCEGTCKKPWRPSTRPRSPRSQSSASAR